MFSMTWFPSPFHVSDSDLLTNSRPSKRICSTYAPLLIPLVLFPLTTALALTALFSVPLPHPIPTAPNPQSLSLIISSIQSYSASADGLFPTYHVIAALSVIAIWKHAWSLPGALLVNVIAGALWGGFNGTLLMILLTAVGSLASTLLSRCMSRWIEGLMPRAVQVTKNVIDTSDSTGSANPDAVWARLALLRLVGIVPWSGINIASGIIRIPIIDCFISTLIGCAPWTAITCHIGDILNDMGITLSQGESDLSFLDILLTPNVIMRLSFLTLLSVVPLFAKKVVRRINAHSVELAETQQFGGALSEKPVFVRKLRWTSLLSLFRPRHFSRVARRTGIEKVPMLPITSGNAGWR